MASIFVPYLTWDTARGYMPNDIVIRPNPLVITDGGEDLPFVKDEHYSVLTTEGNVVLGDKDVYHLQAIAHRKLIADPSYGDYRFNYKIEGELSDGRYYIYEYNSGDGWYQWASMLHYPAANGLFSFECMNVDIKNRRSHGGGGSAVWRWDRSTCVRDYESNKGYAEWGICPTWGYSYTPNLSPFTGQVAYTPIPLGSIDNWPLILGVRIDGDLEKAKQDLFVDCCSQVQVSDNNIQNIMELIDIVQDIRNGKLQELIEDVKKIPEIAKNRLKQLRNMEAAERNSSLLKTAGRVSGSAWLSYRYAYNTTKMDIEDAVDAAVAGYTRILTDQTVKHPLRSHGTYGDYHCNLKLRIKDDFSKNLEVFANKVHTFGLLPTLHVVWDMIPYSFMVDWVFPVDKNLSNFDELYFADSYQIIEALFSYKWEKTGIPYAGSTIDLKCYSRWFENRVPEWTWDDDSSKFWTTRTLKRAADVMSLVVSRVK